MKVFRAIPHIEGSATHSRLMHHELLSSQHKIRRLALHERACIKKVGLRLQKSRNLRRIKEDTAIAMKASVHTSLCLTCTPMKQAAVISSFQYFSGGEKNT